MLQMMNAQCLITCDTPGCNAQEIHGANVTPLPNNPRQAHIDVVVLPRSARGENGEKQSRLGRKATDAEIWHQEPSALANTPPKWYCPKCKIEKGLWPPKAPPVVAQEKAPPVVKIG